VGTPEVDGGLEEFLADGARELFEERVVGGQPEFDLVCPSAGEEFEDLEGLILDDQLLLVLHWL
jgi:hypothetical protein